MGRGTWVALRRSLVNLNGSRVIFGDNLLSYANKWKSATSCM